jgi:hypothetical protein
VNASTGAVAYYWSERIPTLGPTTARILAGPPPD